MDGWMDGFGMDGRDGLQGRSIDIGFWHYIGGVGDIHMSRSSACYYRVSSSKDYALTKREADLLTYFSLWSL